MGDCDLGGMNEPVTIGIVWIDVVYNLGEVGDVDVLI